MRFLSSVSSVTMLIFVARFIVGIIVGRLVYKDASLKKTTLALAIPPFWWSIIVFAEPALGVLTYWLMHYSTLRLQQPDQSEAG